MNKFIQKVILGSRYTLIPVYVGLIAAIILYDINFFQQLGHLISNFRENTEETILLAVLGLVDIVMLTNMVLLILVGSYSIFVSEIHFDNIENRPRFLNALTTGTLKIKMGGSLIGVSSIHLLKSFINIEHVPTDALIKQLCIHFAFIISAFVFAKMENLLHPTTQTTH